MSTLSVLFLRYILMIVALQVIPAAIPTAVSFAQTPEATTDTNHPFVKHLQGVYFKYLEAAQKGDVPGTLRLITAEFADMVSIITPELLKGMAAGELDPREAQFVGVDLSKNKTIARYVYQKLAAEQRDWAAIVFRIESQEWRISRIFRRTQSAKDPLDGLQELLKATEPFTEPNEGSPPSPRH